MKNFERELPEGYEEFMSIDAAEKKLGIILNVAALVMAAVIIIPSFFVLMPQLCFSSGSGTAFFVFCLSMLAYIVLHELTHGAAYKILTGEKLTFGFTATVAYCGVPNIYVYRRASLIALLAPFTVFSIVFLTAALIVADPLYKLLCLTLFALHFGGCVGDLYDTLLYLFRLRDPEILMRDTGPKQVFYGRKAD